MSITTTPQSEKMAMQTLDATLTFPVNCAINEPNRVNFYQNEQENLEKAQEKFHTNVAYLLLWIDLNQIY